MLETLIALTILLSKPREIVIIPMPDIVYAEVSAYTATPEETDIDFLITASGKEVTSSTAACPNYLDFYTKIKVQGKIYTCLDRMAARYRDKHNFDLLFSSKKEALSFGRQKLHVQILD